MRIALNFKVVLFPGLGLVSSVAMSQEVPDHPRVNEVNQPLDNQRVRINQGLATGP